MPGPRSRTAMVSPSAPTRRAAPRSATPAGEYCAAFSSSCESAAAVRRGSSRTSRSESADDIDRRGRAATAPRGCAPPRRSPTAPPSACPAVIAPASMRAISRMFWNRRVSRSTSVRIRSLCSRRSCSSGHDACRLLAATRIAVSGVRRSWPSEASSADFSSSLWRARSAALRSSRNCARSIAIAARPATASSVRASIGRPAAAEQADRLARRAAAARIATVRRARRSARCPSSTRLKAADSSRGIERQPQRAGLEDEPLAPLRHADRHVVEIEAARDEAGERRVGRLAVGDEQDVAAQIEQARQLVAPRLGLLRARARDRRQVARDQADGEEREQRDPVLRIGDRQRADRRQEEEVEGQHRGKRGRRPRPTAATSPRPAGRR